MFHQLQWILRISGSSKAIQHYQGNPEGRKIEGEGCQIEVEVVVEVEVEEKISVEVEWKVASEG